MRVNEGEMRASSDAHIHNTHRRDSRVVWCGCLWWGGRVGGVSCGMDGKEREYESERVRERVI